MLTIVLTDSKSKENFTFINVFKDVQKLVNKKEKWTRNVSHPQLFIGKNFKN